MEQLEALKRKLESTEDLQSVVKTMKSLAAVNIREYERSVESLEQYSQNIEMGLQILMRDRGEDIIKQRSLKERTESLGVVVFGSVQGMVGQFNDRIASFAYRKIDEFEINLENLYVLAIGERMRDLLEARNHSVVNYISLFESLRDLTSFNQKVLLKVEEWRHDHGVERIILFHNKPSQKTSFQPSMHHLLPLDLDWLTRLGEREWPSRVLPTYTMEWDRLFSSLIRQYFFVSIYTATVESLASENASRLASMQAAEKNIEEKLEEINNRYMHVRQQAITSELLDIISGFEVLSSEDDS
ncbi:MAG: F0F1 ATP synthase subunit gamma [Candidatus Aminicenantes bacterium]|nr:F0F1 ATP synthase subunit gamma [Candidatus Aminicenantes bacterium]